MRPNRPTPLRVLRYGRNAPPQKFIGLRAGPLRLSFDSQAGDLRQIRLGDREVLRRIRVDVRDQDFRTIPGRLVDVEVDRRGRGFTISVTSEHQDGVLDFRWRGTLTGDERGRVRFVMNGTAHSGFLANRIGICVLHPVEECAGAPFTVLHVDGSEEHLRFPRFIAPHQPTSDVRSIRHEVVPGCSAEVRLDGEVFEMEDQRNWTDASYKTYSTPLRLPRPVWFERGAVIGQSAELIIDEASTALPRSSRPSRTTVLTLGSPSAKLFPRIGLSLPQHGGPLGANEIARLRMLNLSHLRTDLHLRDPQYPSILRSAAQASAALQVPLEVAVYVTSAAEEEVHALRDLVEQVGPSISAWLVFEEDTEATTTDRWVKLVRAQLGGPHPSAKIGAGTDRYFTQINRNHPPVEALDLVCYPLNPQVHAVDELSLVENLAGQAMTVESAHRIAGSVPLAISPVTLRSRSWRTDVPSMPDPRLGSLFGAAWTVGSLKYLAESEVYSATYHETSGPSGIMASWERSAPDTVFPVYHVFAEIGPLVGGAVVPVLSSDPLQAVGLAARCDGRTRLIVANLVPRRADVVVRDVGGVVRVTYLDETNAETAMRAPQEFHERRREPVALRGGELSLKLHPYAVAVIDLEALPA